MFFLLVGQEFCFLELQGSQIFFEFVLFFAAILPNNFMKDRQKWPRNDHAVCFFLPL